MSRMTDLLHLSHVPRWTITPMSRPQSVAEHSFRVAVIAVELLDAMPHNLPLPVDWDAHKFMHRLMGWCLLHDAAEAYTGDIPSPLKQVLQKQYVMDLHHIDHILCPWLEEIEEQLIPEIRAIVKLADTLEALSWVTAYGNGAKNLYDNSGARIEDALYARILQESGDMQREFGGRLRGLTEAVCSVLKEIAPHKLEQPVTSSDSTAK